MKQWALTIILATLALNSAQAASCDKSRDYLLGSLGGDLPEPPQAYQALFKVCMATAAMANVKDAFILKDGGIAVIRQARQRPGDGGNAFDILHGLPARNTPLYHPQGTASGQVHRESGADVVDRRDALPKDHGQFTVVSVSVVSVSAARCPLFRPLPRTSSPIEGR